MDTPACHCPTCGAQVDPLDVLLERERCTITFGGSTAQLTPGEMDFACALIDAHPRTVTKDALYGIIYGHLPDGGPEPKILDVHACKVRKKLDPLGLIITTAWGIGYGIVVDDAANADAIKRRAFVDTRKSRRALDRADYGRIRELRERGGTVMDIAAQMRLTYRAVSDAVRVIAEEDRKAEMEARLALASLPKPRSAPARPARRQHFVAAAE